ncbi:MAG: hypothetical protein AB1428_06945 [Bacteroidota bacterium]
MRKLLSTLLAGSLLAALVTLDYGCKKDDGTTNPIQTVPTYPVAMTVQSPSGQPQGGALVSLKNPPYADPTFQAYTDTAGKATIMAPEGPQTIVAKMGTIFQTEVNVTVVKSTSPLVVPPVRLVQNTALKVLVVKASAEQLEDVLRVIGFTTFDSTTIYALRDSANLDSARTLNSLRQYSLIFSDCDGGSEGSSNYAALSRVYGRYVQGGGKMYGGHYNYYHLQRVWTTYFDAYDYQGNSSTDTLRIIDQNLSSYVGYSIARWNSIDSRNLSGYEKFSDLPATSKVYAVIKNTSPQVGVIVENYVGTGKYLWTDYHNQDIKDDPNLVKLVKYFLYSL